MPGQSKQLKIGTSQAICGRHGEIFRAKWPEGYTTFIGIGLECLLSQPAFAVAVRKVVNGEYNGIEQTNCDLEAVERLLTEKPMCCRIPPDDLLEIFIKIGRELGLWSNRVCALCKRKGYGVKYRRTRPTVTEQAPNGYFDHVCIRCVADTSKMNPAT